MNYNTKEELASIIENKTAENLQLEFKSFEFLEGKVNDKVKEALAKEITALANAEGGHIIIGIDEDGKRMASKFKHVNCNLMEFDGIQLSIQQYLLAKVRPRLYGVSMEAIEYEQDKIAIVIFVPKSFSRPHAVNDGNKDNFYIRHSNGVTNMSVDDLRNQFIFTSSYKHEIKRFRTDRIGMILSRECIGNLADGAMVLVHIIPLWSLDSGNSIDISKIKNQSYSYKMCTISSDSTDNRYNTDGFCLANYSNEVNKKINSYCQIFRNGIIELLDLSKMNSLYSDDLWCYWFEVENYIYRTIKAYECILDQLNIRKPWYIYITFLNAKGLKIRNEFGFSKPIEREIVDAIECIWDDENQTLDSVIKPTFDSLANAFGMSKSPNYAEDGTYIQR